MKGEMVLKGNFKMLDVTTEEEDVQEEMVC